MSTTALAHVLRKSTATKSALLVHLMIADTVNEQHDHLFWADVEWLSAKTRLDERTVRRALDVLVDAGWLVREAGGAAEGRPTVFRFVFRDDASNVWDGKGHSDRPRGSVRKSDRVGQICTPGRSESPTPYKEERKEEREAERGGSDQVADIEIDLRSAAPSQLKSLKATLRHLDDPPADA